MSFLARLIINGVALWLITYFGFFNIHAQSTTAIIVGALVLGLANAIVRPILIVVSCPLEILSLGLFTLVINGLIFLWFLNLVPGFHVPGFWAGFWGAIIMSVISWVLSLAFQDPHRART